MINLVKLTIVFLIILPFGIFDISDGSVMHEDKLRPCLTIILPTPVDLIEDDFDDRVKEIYNVNMKKPGLFNGGNLMVAEEVDIPAISNKTMDFYSITTKENDNSSKLEIFAAFGYDEYLNLEDHPAAHKELKRFITSFIDFHLNKYYSETLEEVIEEQEDLVKDKEQLEKKIQKNNKDILENIEDNEKMSKEIVGYKSELNVNAINKEEVIEKKKMLENNYRKFQKEISQIKEKD